MKATATAILIAMTLGSAAHAELGLPQMQSGTGIAQIIAREAKCGYKIDRPALQKYMASKNLAEPDVLSWITTQTQMESENVDGLSEAACAVTEATAKQMGVIQN